MGIPSFEPIAIIGGGAFGLSTALELIQQGYTNVTVFEKDEEIPSRWSAANDLNKIARAEYEDDFYTDLAVQAQNAWQTPLFAPHFHRVGFLNCCSGAASAKAVDTCKRFQASAERHPEMKKYVKTINSADDIRATTWQFTGELPGWKGYLNLFDGYVHSANALRSVYKKVRAEGVRFFLGADAGAISEIVYKDTPQGRRSTGVRTKNGRFHPAALVIVAAGAAATTLVPEAGSTIVAKSWSVAHVLCTDEETSALRGIPVTYARDLGFFFEPDPKTNLLKLCPMGGGYINTDPKTGLSQPPQSPAESSFLPPGDEKKLRELLRQTLPALADRPFVRKSLCWFADTSDSDFVIDYVPNTSSTVMFLSGDSGHGFKLFPIVGHWVRDLLKASDNKQSITRWQWRDPKNQKDAGDVSWRVGDVTEFKDIRPVAGPAKL
ncbi:FAD dependent oxidoreductase [Aaosphaeria arxii CBS 175.79]|uniref:FAD dependent oxidoreductase n=1 Tax=Aaosphaeria arxii CBS 175.79 TaxID=1450172 RepID=A0A6A5Y327_9PLEO|nr:FAD dependent oxidoreductase [Aaosphaeria arxii CBS 175.79]KAF2019447.1 FAD dependent oxidoreductase [Aaosphaeria arxii CBS 175.79]